MSQCPDSLKPTRSKSGIFNEHRRQMSLSMLSSKKAGLLPHQPSLCQGRLRPKQNPRSEPAYPISSSSSRASFDESLISSSPHGALLARIKGVFEASLKQLETTSAQKQAKITELTSQLQSEKQVKKQLRKRHQSVSYELIEANDTFGKYNEAIDKIQRALEKQLRAGGHHLPIIATQKRVNSIKVNIDTQKKKLDELKKLVAYDRRKEELLRKKGLPVDEILENEVDPMKNRRLWLEIPSFQANSEGPSRISDSMKTANLAESLDTTLN